MRRNAAYCAPQRMRHGTTAGTPASTVPAVRIAERRAEMRRRRPEFVGRLSALQMRREDELALRSGADIDHPQLPVSGGRLHDEHRHRVGYRWGTSNL